MPKVLHVCETAKGGIGTYINTLCKITSDHYINSVIAPDIHRNVLSASIDVQEFRHSGRGTGTLVRLAWATLAEIFRNRPDIVFFHSSFALFPMVLARCVFWWKPFIYCAHGWADGREASSFFKSAAVRFLEGRLCGFSSVTVNVSVNDRLLAERNGYSGKQVLIENAVLPPEVSEAVPICRDKLDEITISFVGRLDRQKGLDILVEAFSNAKKNNEKIKLKIAGERVISRSESIDKDSAIEFLGWMAPDQVNALLNESDLLVVPSRWEGLPLVIPEALRCGTPVLVSDRSNLPSLIEDGISGFKTPLDVDSLSLALTNLDKKSLIAMRPACIDLFNRRYHADRLKTEIESLYGELLT